MSSLPYYPPPSNQLQDNTNKPRPLVPPKTPNQIEDLFSTFNVAQLGDGDVAAGANVLAAMCISLANIYHPDSRVVSNNGNTMKVGCSFLVSGHLTEGLIDEKVFSHITEGQNNYSSHIEELHEFTAREMAKAPLVRHLPEHPIRKAGCPLLLTVSDESNFATTTMRDLALPSRLQSIQTTFTRPGVFLEGSNPTALEKQLKFANRGRPFVHLKVTSLPHADKLSGVFHGVTGGLTMDSPLAHHIKGELTATVPPAILAESSESKKQVGWFNELLWLVDDSVAKVEAPKVENSRATATHQLYVNALGLAWGSRLNFKSPTPAYVLVNFEPIQMGMVSFLKENEAACPGITNFGRPLLGTLMFGLQMLIHEKEQVASDTLPWNALAFAKYLVKRMVAARKAPQRIAQLERRNLMAERMVYKLESGPLDARAITRKFTALRMPECNDLLDFLRVSGVVQQTGKEWELAIPVVQAMEQLQSNTIDV